MSRPLNRMPDINLDLLSDASPVNRMTGLRLISEGFPSSEDTKVELALVAVLIADESAIVRHEAAFLLANLRDRQIINGQHALPALLRATVDPSILVRHEAALSLASFPGPATMATLKRLAGDSIEDVATSAKFALEELAMEGHT